MSRFLASRSRAVCQAFRRRRGPALTHTVEMEGYYLTHSVTNARAAERATGPLVDDDLVVLCDGEVYDRPAELGTPEVVLREYRRHGEDFARHLDGDFAVAVYDFGRRVLTLATDPFGSKPLFAKGTETASHLCDLDGGERLPPNTLKVADLDGPACRTSIVEPFDFDHQQKESYDDWIAAFERAVSKRAVEGCYLPLSGGYDSGGIDCALAALGIEYKAYSIAAGENEDLVRRRNRCGEILAMDRATFEERKAFLSRFPEASSFRVAIVNDDGSEETYDALDDPASCGLALIHSLARAEGRSVSLSGTGGDETVAGLPQWPEVLRPWPDFGGRWGAAYQGKEELVAGVFGVEARYPFFDRALVQENLWLRTELKNRHYKAPLHEYLTRNGYPFDEGVKKGFLPLQGYA